LSKKKADEDKKKKDSELAKQRAFEEKKKADELSKNKQLEQQIMSPAQVQAIIPDQKIQEAQSIQGSKSIEPPKLATQKQVLPKSEEVSKPEEPKPKQEASKPETILPKPSEVQKPKDTQKPEMPKSKEEAQKLEPQKIPEAQKQMETQKMDTTKQQQKEAKQIEVGKLNEMTPKPVDEKSKADTSKAVEIPKAFEQKPEEISKLAEVPKQKLIEEKRGRIPEVQRQRPLMQIIVTEQKFVHPERLKPEDERAKEIPYGGSPKLYKISLNIILSAAPETICFDIFFFEPNNTGIEATISRRLSKQASELLKTAAEPEIGMAKKGGEILPKKEEAVPLQPVQNLPKAAETPKFAPKFQQQHTDVPNISVEPSLSADDIMYTSTSSTTSEQVKNWNSGVKLLSKLSKIFQKLINYLQ
jgi:hypothetical protein